jgi:two-component system, chemotaxis family, protein-glutamate methylesterase/glutaminase
MLLTREKRIKVLVVDDSMVFREVLSRGISSDPEIEVVAAAADPFDARDKIIKYEPDVMTCDVQMPRMNGIEFVKKLIPQYPIPVIMVSTIDKAVFDALNAGAVDFVTKPDVRSVRDIENFIYELISKIKIAAAANLLYKKSSRTSACVNDEQKMNFNVKVIAIGASTGGTEAIYNVLKNLPSTIPGIVIVQHIPPGFSNMFAERLNNFTSFEVKEACTGDIIEKGKVLIAPGDLHMKVKKVGDKFMVECFKGEKVNGHCPSVDLLFDSVAREVGNKSIGTILTGMGYDGAKGLLSMRRKGARTIGQDQKSSIVYGMPRVAFEIGAVEKQVSIEDIPQQLYNMLY